MQYFQYYDSSTNSYVIQDPRSSGANKSMKVPFTSFYARLTLRNNTTTPQKITVYRYEAKVDTDTPPTTFYASLMKDDVNVINQPTAAGANDAYLSPLMHITDNTNVNKTWKLVSTKAKYLQPGDHMKCVASKGPFTYDVDYFISNTSEYSSKMKATVFIVRIEGDLAHNNNVTPIREGQGNASVDYMIDTIYTSKYACGGPGQKFWVLDDISTLQTSNVDGVYGNRSNPTNKVFAETA